MQIEKSAFALELTDGQLKALQLIRVYTRGTMDVFMLAGDRHKDYRQTIMRHWTGKKTPKPLCGVNALYAEIKGTADLQGEPTCASHEQRMVRAWMLASLAGVEVGNA